jgi:hypothetical protein
MLKAGSVYIQPSCNLIFIVIQEEPHCRAYWFKPYITNDHSIFTIFEHDLEYIKATWIKLC